MLAGTPAGDGARSEEAVAAEGRLDLEAVDAKLVGLDKKIERIAGAVGARIGSGVSEAAIAGGGGGIIF